MKQRQIQALQLIYQKIPKANCQGLCVETCGPIGMEKGEFLNITRIASISEMKEDLVCGFLKEGKCSVYSRRPAVCRLWGVSRAMPLCLFGCVPDRLLTKQESDEILDEVRALCGDGKMYFNADIEALEKELRENDEQSDKE